MAAGQRIGYRISSTIFLEGPISQNKNIIKSSYYFFPGGLRSTRRIFQAFSGPSSEAFRWLCQVEDIFMSSKGPLRRSGPSQSSEGPLKYSEKPFERSKGPLERSDEPLLSGCGAPWVEGPRGPHNCLRPAGCRPAGRWLAGAHFL